MTACMNGKPVRINPASVFQHKQMPKIMNILMPDTAGNKASAAWPFPPVIKPHMF